MGEQPMSTTEATEATQTAETPKPGPPAQNVSNDGETSPAAPATLPDDHPLVKALAAQKAEITSLKVKVSAFEDANKSEAERAADDVAAAKAEATEAKAELLRYRTAAEHGITDAEDIELFLTGTDEETLQRQAKALAARSATAAAPRAPIPDPNQGRNGEAPRSKGDAFADFAGNFFSR